MEGMEKQHFYPDFLITPYELIKSEVLRPTDVVVYGILYWFEHLKDGRCTAGNQAIADVARADERTVRGALNRLEKAGFIRRVYFDKSRKLRSHIETLVKYARVSPPNMPPIIESKVVEQPDRETPGAIAREFFDPASQRRHQVAQEICEATGAPKDAVIAELKKFIMYWTEPNKSGTKQKWQLQQTFDVKRRIYTWLARAQVRGSVGARSGAGVTI
jgi:DNA-binding Lrp family transcriptional regulator